MIDNIDMLPGGVDLNKVKRQRRSFRYLTEKTVLLETKDGAYASLGDKERLLAFGNNNS